MTRHHSTCVIFRCWRATLLVVDWLSRVRMCLSSAAGQASSVSLLDTWGHMYASPIRRTLPRFLPLPGSPRHCTLSSSSISLCRRAEHTAHSSRSWSAISCSTICSQMSRLQNSTGACVASFPVRQITCRTWLQFYTLSHKIVPRAKPLPELQRQDLILAADCVYFEPAFPLLVSTLAGLVPPPPERAPEVLFCYKKRRRADKRFFALLKKYFTWSIVRGQEPTTF